MSATNCHAEYPWCKAKHCWCTIDAHFQNGAGSVSISILLMNAAYTWFMNVCIKLPLSIPKMRDQKLLTHCGLSFSGWGWELVSLLFDYKGNQYIRNGQWYTNVHILQLAIEYLNAIINRKSQKPEQEIGTDGSCKTQSKLWDQGYGSRFGMARCSRSGFWTG